MGLTHLRNITWALLLLSYWRTATDARVVQLVAENPSTFVSTDPNEPKYIVSLFENEIKAAEVLSDGAAFRSTVMTDAKGQQYNCTVPSSPSSWSTSLAQEQDETLPPPVTKTPFELLDSLTGMCFYRQDGLWTYEVCHRKHVRQFRQVSFTSTVSTTSTASGTATVINLSGQGDLDAIFDAISQGEDLSKLVGDLLHTDDASKPEDFSCGKYTGDDQQIESVLEDTSSSGHPLKYVSHTYSGGAECALTGASRSAEVRYTCVRDTKDNIVLSVREFPTCNYVVVVSTPFLCKHPGFVPPAEDLRLISCIPIGLEKQPTGADKQPTKAAALPATPSSTAEAASGSVKTAKPPAGKVLSSQGSSSGSSSGAPAPSKVLEGDLLSADSIADSHDDQMSENEPQYNGDYDYPNQPVSEQDEDVGESVAGQQQTGDSQQRQGSQGQRQAHGKQQGNSGSDGQHEEL